mmetsp:Transcript_9844/g.28295  ORF Transcript_9844/g.28295 Transcript_9844/m.28295 type:complete len:120 (-) Transcript_9844:28-387(-)
MGAVSRIGSYDGGSMCTISIGGPSGMGATGGGRSPTGTAGFAAFASLPPFALGSFFAAAAGFAGILQKRRREYRETTSIQGQTNQTATDLDKSRRPGEAQKLSKSEQNVLDRAIAVANQ